MEILNQNQNSYKMNHAFLGRRAKARYSDASGYIYRASDGHIRLYATVTKDGDFGKIQRVLFIKDGNNYYFIPDEKGNRMLFLHKDQKVNNSKMLLRLTCNGFPHKGGKQWFLGDFTDETKTRIKLTFDE